MSFRKRRMEQASILRFNRVADILDKDHKDAIKANKKN